MAVTDTVTDDTIAWLLDNQASLNTMRKGQLVVTIQDKRLVAVAVTVEQRVGYEIDREKLAIDKRSRVVYDVGR